MHVQFDVHVGRTRFVNAGSVGMLYEGVAGVLGASGRGGRAPPTPYDLDLAGFRIRTSGFPEPDEFVATLTQPPAAEEATAYFEQAAAERGVRH